MKRTYFIKNKSKKLRENTLDQIKNIRDSLDPSTLLRMKQMIGGGEDNLNLTIDKEKNISTIKRFLDTVNPKSNELKLLKDRLCKN